MSTAALLFLPASLLLDRLLGEAPSRWHPVCGMGWLALRMEEGLRRGDSGPGMTLRGHSQHEAHEEPDEHIWTSPAYAMRLVQKICDTLCEVMPEKENIFWKNAKDYVNQIKKVDKQFTNIVNHSQKKEIIFADKFPLKYFAQEYGLNYYAAFPGCSGDTEPSAKTVAFLIDKIKERGINGVFYLELSSQAMADVICDDTDVKKYQFHSCHNITQEQFDSGVTYVDLMWENAEALAEVFNETEK